MPSLTLPALTFKKQSSFPIAVVVVVSVFILHGITVWWLLNMSSPLFNSTEPQQNNLIEITMLNLVENAEPLKPTQKSVAKVVPPKPVLKPNIAKPKPKSSVRAKTKSTPMVTKPVVKKPQSAVKNPIIHTKNKVIVTDNRVAENPNQWEVEQQRIAEAKAQADRASKAQAEREAKAQAERKAKAQAEREAKAQAERDAKTTNVRLSASDASWRKKPNFQVKSGKARSGEEIKVEFRFAVDKQGNITNVELITPSKYRQINRELIRQAKRGKFHPFKNKAGVPISGKLNLQMIITVP